MSSCCKSPVKRSVLSKKRPALWISVIHWQRVLLWYRLYLCLSCTRAMNKLITEGNVWALILILRLQHHGIILHLTLLCSAFPEELCIPGKKAWSKPSCRLNGLFKVPAHLLQLVSSPSGTNFQCLQGRGWRERRAGSRSRSWILMRPIWNIHLLRAVDTTRPLQIKWGSSSLNPLNNLS